jgi:hypothetical protein
LWWFILIARHKGKETNENKMVNKRTRNSKAKANNKPAKNKSIAVKAPKKRTKNLERLLEGVCAVTDPFCPAAATAKWSSVGSVHTLTQRVMFELRFLTDTNGYGCLVWMPTIDKYQANLASNTYITSGSNLTISSGVYSTMLANFKRARIVSAGCTWSNTSSANEVGGSTYVHEIEDYASYNVNSGTIRINEFGYFSNEQMSNRMQSGSFVSRPLTEDAYEFALPNLSYDATLANYRRTGIFIGCYGAASSIPIVVQCYVNYEFTFDTAEMFGGRLSVPKPLKDETQMISQVATDVDNIMPSFFRRAGDRIASEVKSYALDAIGNLASNTVSAIATYLGGPAGGFATKLIMDVD